MKFKQPEHFLVINTIKSQWFCVGKRNPVVPMADLWIQLSMLVSLRYRSFSARSCIAWRSSPGFARPVWNCSLALAWWRSVVSLFSTAVWMKMDAALRHFQIPRPVGSVFWWKPIKRRENFPPKLIKSLEPKKQPSCYNLLHIDRSLTQYLSIAIPNRDVVLVWVDDRSKRKLFDSVDVHKIQIELCGEDRVN